jgi:hypothetical protein
MSHYYDFDPSELDEFLVEYVDGTMDPVVRQAFEEFLRVYPEVRAEVDCLMSVRTELCRLGDDCRCKAPPGFQDRLKRQLACEASGGDGSLEHLAPQLNVIALAFSLTILALAVGLSRVEPLDSLAVKTIEEPKKALAESPPSFAWQESFPLEDEEEGNDRMTLSTVHQITTASAFSAAFDRPVLMSVRRDFVAMKPVVMQVAP